MPVRGSRRRLRLRLLWILVVLLVLGGWLACPPTARAMLATAASPIAAL